jgi:sigma-B regulation protein RsbU (phosphoserine phosphatase)
VTTLLSCTLLRWIMPVNETFWTLFRESAPIVVVVCMASGIIAYLVSEVQEKLKEKNRQLQQAVERGTTALHQQEQELNRAREIQQDLMPKELPQLPRVAMAGAWQPARTVGGDYFDVIQLDSNRLGICIGDVAGKGITAALLMANLQASFRAFATPEESPAAVCAKLNAFLCSNLAPGKFVTFFYAILNAEDRTLRYENAGHCPAILVKAGGETELLSGDGAVLGVLPDWQYRDFSVQLAAGDRLLFFTDGVTEAANVQFEEFGNERVIGSVRAMDGTLSALATQRKLLEEVTRFCASNFQDDATILVAAIH